MTGAAPSPASAPTGFPWAFLAHETLAVARSRRVKLIVGLLIYTLVAAPFLLVTPPPEVAEAVEAFFGDGSTFTVFVFIWFDLAMNKLAVFSGAILAGGIVTDERTAGRLDLLLAKPIRRSHYFLAKLGAALIVMAGLYAILSLAATVTFLYRVEGFRPGAFLAMAAVHLFAPLFAASFAASLAVCFRRKITAIVVSILALSLLVGFAFIGFYIPSLYAVGTINPFFHAVSPIASLDALGPLEVAVPIVVLIAWIAALAAFGAWRTGRIEVDG